MNGAIIAADDRDPHHRQNEHDHDQSSVANAVVHPQRVIRKKMADHVTAIQRRQRDQVEHRQNHVDLHRIVKQLGQRLGDIGAASLAADALRPSHAR